MPIYFVRAGSELVRIFHSGRGFSHQAVLAQIKKGQTWTALDLKVDHKRYGGESLVDALHELWKDRKVRDDWFLWTGDMAPSIARPSLEPRVDKRRGPKPGKPSPQNVKIIAILQAGGRTMQDVATEFKITRERVRQIAKREGIDGKTIRATLPPSKRVLNAAERTKARAARKAASLKLHEDRTARILEMHDRGMTGVEISKRMGVAQTSISRYLIAAGVQSNVGKGNRKPRIAKVRIPKEPRPPKVKPPKPAKPPRPVPPPMTMGEGADLLSNMRQLWKLGFNKTEIATHLTNGKRPLSRDAVVGLINRNRDHFPRRHSSIQRFA